LWRRWFASCASRPLRAAVAARSRSSDEGGVRSVATGDFDRLFFFTVFFFVGRLAERLTARFAAGFGRFFVFFRDRFAIVRIPFKSLTGLR
jgi:hypothetical protein